MNPRYRLGLALYRLSLWLNPELAKASVELAQYYAAQLVQQQNAAVWQNAVAKRANRQ